MTELKCVASPLGHTPENVTYSSTVTKPGVAAAFDAFLNWSVAVSCSPVFGMIVRESSSRMPKTIPPVPLIVGDAGKSLISSVMAVVSSSLNVISKLSATGLGLFDRTSPVNRVSATGESPKITT